MPGRPSGIEISLETMPQMPTAIAYGVTCRPPEVKKSSYCFSPTSMPPPPVPISTRALISPYDRPASFHASRAAITPNSAAREYRFGSARPCDSWSPSMGAADSIDTGGTDAAPRTGKVDPANVVMARVPLTPPLTLRQKQSRPAPNGDTTPIPLMTTRGSPFDCICAHYNTGRAIDRRRARAACSTDRARRTPLLYRGPALLRLSLCVRVRARDDGTNQLARGRHRRGALHSICVPPQPVRPRHDP